MRNANSHFNLWVSFLWRGAVSTIYTSGNGDKPATAWGKKNKKKTQHKELFHLTFFFEKLMATQHHTKLVYKCNAMLSDVEIPKDCEILSKELLTCAWGYTAELQI